MGSFTEVRTEDGWNGEGTNLRRRRRVGVDELIQAK